MNRTHILVFAYTCEGLYATVRYSGRRINNIEFPISFFLVVNESLEIFD